MTNFDPVVAQSEMSHGLLLLMISGFDSPLGDAFHAIQRALVLVHRLTIVISVIPSAGNSKDPHNNDNIADTINDNTPSSAVPSASFHNVQRLLSALYVSFTKEAMAMKKPLAELDIVIEDICGYPIGTGVADLVPFDIFIGLPDATRSLQELNEKRERVGQTILPLITLDLSSKEAMHTHLIGAIDSSLDHHHHTVAKMGEYQDVALGGTFDHLHAGHKILLSMTAWITNHRVVCGVTDDSMLKTKKFKEFMEPLDDRIKAVERFLHTFKRKLVLEVVPIHDIYGPTITDNKLQALMVSKETLKGGAAVNEERSKRNLSPLNIEVINVISPTEIQVDEVSRKISSTYIRQYLSEQAQDLAAHAGII
ncbi:hypothetical protein BX616_002148 [Lobosporangium transversale]|nr:hypothetical protein BX616_002148 [Lobosporangium transversale]